MAEHWLIEAKKNGCGVLPRAAERELMAAANAPPIRRAFAIDRAYDRTTEMFPELFKE